MSATVAAFTPASEPKVESSSRRLVAPIDQNGMDVVTEQLFGEFGLVAVGRDVVGERAEDLVAEATTAGEQCRSGRSEPDAIALERLERRPARRDSRDILLDGPALREFAGFAVAGLAQEQS